MQNEIKQPAICAGDLESDTSILPLDVLLPGLSRGEIFNNLYLKI